MTRRLAMAQIIGVFFSAAVALAQPPAHKPLLAVLESGSAPKDPASALRPFWKGMHDLGRQQEQNLTVERRYADWNIDRLPSLLAELARLKPDVLYAHSTAAAQAAKHTVVTIPVVIGLAGDLVGMGVVASLAKPGGNITGMTSLNPQLDAKRLELLHDVVPKLSRVGVLGYAANPTSSAIDAARAMSLQLRRTAVRTATEIEGAMDALIRWHPEAVLVEDAHLLSAHRERIAAACLRHRLASMSQIPEFADVGGLLQYGIDHNDVFRRSATLVDKILRGAKPGDLPVEQPTKLALTVNLKTAKILGITIPPLVLVRADRFIQ